MVVVHLAALRLVVVADVAAAPPRLQALLHAQGLRVVIHVDNVLPAALGRLAALGLSVLDLGRAQKAALGGEIAVFLPVGSVTALSPIVPIVVVGGVGHLLIGGHAVDELVGRLVVHLSDHVVAHPAIGAQQGGDLLQGVVPHLQAERVGEKVAVTRAGTAGLLNDGRAADK